MILDINEFERYLKINKYDLDEEIVQHPSLLFRVSDALAQANSQRDGLKKVLDEVDAKLDHDIREDFERAGDKYTEGRIKNLIIADPGHKRAYKGYAEARAAAARLEALQEAFKVRGYMIRDLCSLHVANYYETESVRGTNRTDLHVYNQRKTKLNEHRQKRGE